MLVPLALPARAFHAGADHLALPLVRSQGAGPATDAVSAGYGAFHVLATLNPAILAILAGWVVLALGAWRTRVLGPVRAAVLGPTKGVVPQPPPPTRAGSAGNGP